MTKSFHEDRSCAPKPMQVGISYATVSKYLRMLKKWRKKRK